jgi:hypothetical protein
MANERPRDKDRRTSETEEEHGVEIETRRSKNDPSNAVLTDDTDLHDLATDSLSGGPGAGGKLPRKFGPSAELGEERANAEPHADEQDGKSE